MTEPRPPAAERSLLRRLRFRLALVVLLTLLCLAGGVIGVTYIALGNQLQMSAQTAIRQEWSSKLGDFREQMAARRQSPDDWRPETVATWIILKDGQVLTRDQRLPNIPFPLQRILPSPRLDACAQHVRSACWTTVSLVGRSVYVGVRPVYDHHHRLLGYVESAYSLVQSQSLLKKTLQSDLMVALGVLLVSVGASFGLTLWIVSPIREALKKQREFVHNASHELRTPLTVLRSALDVSDLQGSAAETPAMVTFRDEVDHMTKIVGDLATLARADSGATQLNWMLVDLSRLVEKSVTSIRPLAATRNLSLTLNVQSPGIRCRGDEMRLHQLMLILLDNAVKYNQPGGSIWVGLDTTGRRQAALVVKDTGVGISRDDLPNIFNRFYRGGHSAGIATGSGLGLAIARWIVSEHHGTIRITSEVNQGTTVMVELPLRIRGDV